MTTESTTPAGLGLPRWHAVLAARDVTALPALITADAVFHSPVVHTPQVGRARVAGYLGAAFQVLGRGPFRYLREVVGHDQAVLEFETEIDGIYVNGIDWIRWDADGQIVDFKVMLRPAQALGAVQAQMAALLATGR
jgi:hypothetical protein